MRSYMATNDDRKIVCWEAMQRAYLLQRYQVSLAAAGDPEFQRLARALVHSPDGLWFFLRNYGVAFEPRKFTDGRPTGWIPLIPFLHQEDVVSFFMDVYRQGHVGLNVKTREMGVSWIIYPTLVWLWLTQSDFSVLFGSRTEDLVDKSSGSMDRDTIFGRIENILDKLPRYLQPRGFDLSDKAQRMKMLLRNPENGNVFQGEATTGEFGRQRRASLGFADEFDFWENAMGAVTALRDSCGAVWLVTTPNPRGNQIARRIKEEGKARVLELPWELHPYKTTAWYNEERKWRFDESMATEIGLSWDGSITNLIYPEYARAAKGTFAFEPGWPLYAGWDWGRSDGTGLVVAQRNPGGSKRWRILASYYRAGQAIEFFLPFFGGPLLSGQDEYSEEDLALIEVLKRWYAEASQGVQFFGDPSGHQHHQTGALSVIEILGRHRIYVRTNSRAQSHEDRQTATRTLLRNCEVNTSRCGMLEWSATRYKRAERSANTTAARLIAPVHNRASHVMSALEYIAVNAPDLSSDDQVTEPARHAAAWEKRVHSA